MRRRAPGRLGAAVRRLDKSRPSAAARGRLAARSSAALRLRHLRDVRGCDQPALARASGAPRALHARGRRRPRRSPSSSAPSVRPAFSAARSSSPTTGRRRAAAGKGAWGLQNNADRRRSIEIARPDDPRFSWVIPPVLNHTTRLVVEMSAAGTRDARRAGLRDHMLAQDADARDARLRPQRRRSRRGLRHGVAKRRASEAKHFAKRNVSKANSPCVGAMQKMHFA